MYSGCHKPQYNQIFVQPNTEIDDNENVLLGSQLNKKSVALRARNMMKFCWNGNGHVEIIISKLLKRHSIVRSRAPAYSRALHQIRGVVKSRSPWEVKVRWPEEAE